ncbi:MAG: ABC transporter permease [Phycisphaerae bacterium]
MNRILTIARKDLRLLARDRLGLFFIVLFPVIYGVFFGIINGGMMGGHTASMPIAIVDEDGTADSALFVKDLSGSKAVELVTAPSRAAAADAVRRAKQVAYIAIPKGFGQTAGFFGMSSAEIEVGIDPSRSAESGLLQGVLMEASVKLMQARFADPAAMKPQIDRVKREVAESRDLSADKRLALSAFFTALDSFVGSMSGGTNAHAPDMTPLKIQTVDVTATRSEQERLLAKLRSPYELTFPSAMMWGMMGCAAGFATSLVKERSEGTLLRLRVAPLNAWQVLIGKAAACFAACLFVTVLMLVLGRMLGMRWGQPTFLALAGLSTAICWVGVMMLLAIIGKTEQAVASAAWAILVVLAMIGGGMVPLMFLPKALQKLAVISPIRWGVEAMEGAIWRGYSLTEMLRPCAVLVAIGAGAFLVGTLRFSRGRDA